MLSLQRVWYSIIWRIVRRHSSPLEAPSARPLSSLSRLPSLLIPLSRAGSPSIQATESNPYESESQRTDQECEAVPTCEQPVAQQVEADREGKNADSRGPEEYPQRDFGQCGCIVDKVECNHRDKASQDRAVDDTVGDCNDFGSLKRRRDTSSVITSPWSCGSIGRQQQAARSAKGRAPRYSI